MTKRKSDPANFCIFRRDEYGYPRFAASDFETEAGAHELIRLRYTPEQAQGLEVMSYGQYLRERDPDSMSDAEHDRRQARALGASAPETPKRGVVVTGAIRELSRARIVELLQAKGYTPQENVNGKTAFVLAGDRFAPAKVRQAAKLGVEVKSWGDVKCLLN